VIKDVLITKLDIIEVPGGNVLHAMKESDGAYSSFGEVYFSEIYKDAIKAWKRHKFMTLNLVVPFGEVKFVLFDDRKAANIQIQEVVLSKKNYCRITIPPMIWVGFKGLSKDKSLLLNIANIKHDQKEVERKSIEEIKYNWSS
jgi:dTDP-4-dehydrorhamnose 3,5-epimerase